MKKRIEEKSKNDVCHVIEINERRLAGRGYHEYMNLDT